jgi:hypothetical protein
VLQFAHNEIGICDGRIEAFRHACTEADYCFIVEDTNCSSKEFSST